LVVWYDPVRLVVSVDLIDWSDYIGSFAGFIVLVGCFVRLFID
jgi:hypothetical protein